MVQRSATYLRRNHMVLSVPYPNAKVAYCLRRLHRHAYSSFAVCVGLLCGVCRALLQCL